MDNPTGLAGMRQMNLDVDDHARLSDGVQEGGSINAQGAVLVMCLRSEHQPLQREHANFEVEGSSVISHVTFSRTPVPPINVFSALYPRFTKSQGRDHYGKALCLVQAKRLRALAMHSGWGTCPLATGN